DTSFSYHYVTYVVLIGLLVAALAMLMYLGITLWFTRKTLIPKRENSAVDIRENVGRNNVRMLSYQVYSLLDIQAEASAMRMRENAGPSEQNNASIDHLPYHYGHNNWNE
ncbi:unnamed protein product, partial [Meganyctiphanes norvegica]